MMLKELLYLCNVDAAVFRYIYTMKPPTLQYARYSDWFKFYFTEQKDKVVKAVNQYTNSSSDYYTKKLDSLLDGARLVN